MPSDSTSNIVIGLDYNLSPHFTFGAVTRTDHRRWLVQNQIDARQYMDNLSKVCNQLLEPIWTLVGPIIITSVFRCDGLNKAIGGAPTSQHRFGEAADMVFVGAMEGDLLKQAFNKIAFSDLQYSQIIYEFRQWVHVGLIDENMYPKKKLQKMVAERKNNKTVYTVVSNPI